MAAAERLMPGALASGWLVVTVAVAVAAAAPASAQTFTVADLMAEIETARAEVNGLAAGAPPFPDIVDAATMGLTDAERELAEALNAALGRLRQVVPPELPLDALLRSRMPAFLEVARFDTDRAVPARVAGEFRTEWDIVRTVRNRNAVAGEPRGILRRLNEAGRDPDAFFRVYDWFDAELQREAREAALARLGRYERKFGPGSVKLNTAEVLLAYLTQSVPGFRYDPVTGPGPLEIVAGYTTTYFTYAERETRVLSAAEFGLRHYIFADGWGGGRRVSRLLKPGHFAIGVAVSGARDGPLVWPWRGDARTGVFVAWGDLKVAYLGGDNARWLVTQQFQLIPLLF